ncbi:hypothetical protein OHA02_52050 [Streptomyces phaeochromogenes]|nr:hypothetical protein [Streptomyces phaeochromogenes]
MTSLPLPSPPPRNIADAPATVRDLVSDAQERGLTPVTERLVRDWTEEGLLAAPDLQKKTRHGSEQALYPPSQRRLFLYLLWARTFYPHGPHYVRSVLIRALITGWLNDNSLGPIPVGQARRALRTWARAGRTMPAVRARKSAKDFVCRLAHSSAPAGQRRYAEAVLSTFMQTGRWDWKALQSALEPIYTPWADAASGRRMEQELGTSRSQPSLDVVIAHLRESVRVESLLRTESVSLDVLKEAQAVYWSHYGPANIRRILALPISWPPAEHDLGNQAIARFVMCVAEILKD